MGRTNSPRERECGNGSPHCKVFKAVRPNGLGEQFTLVLRVPTHEMTTTRTRITHYFPPQQWDEPTEQQRLVLGWVCRTDCTSRHCGLTMGFTTKQHGLKPRLCPDCMAKARTDHTPQRTPLTPDCILIEDTSQ